MQHGNTGHTAGIIGQDPHTGALVSDDVAEQTAAILNNLETLLHEVGSDLSDLLRTTIYLTDYQDFGAINSVYVEHIKAPFRHAAPSRGRAPTQREGAN